MPLRTIRYSYQRTELHLSASIKVLREIVDRKNSILVTDENLFRLHPGKFKGWKTIVVPPGEAFKVQATADSIISQLIAFEADRSSTLVGVGGGVITDLTGYVASVYMRGLRFGFVPTTILALVDASIGGKNGVDVGAYKNMVGLIRQPDFILHDVSFLATLPEQEWRGGFAEVIKHAAIGDAAMFRELESGGLTIYRKRRPALEALLARNAVFKSRMVQRDEFEQGDRRLLNFGHTLGHALENQYRLSHGEAVAIGMSFASRLSQEITGFKQAARLDELIERYELPTRFNYDRDRVFDVLKMDKKRLADSMRYILLDRIGKARVETIPFDQLYDLLS